MSIKLVVFGMMDTNVKEGYELGLNFQKPMPGFSAEHSRIDQVNSSLNNVSKY